MAGVLHRRGTVLALVLAGGEGGRLGALTAERAKPALPFGGVYRLIDFSLSNCHHSRISDVWVLEQYEAHSISSYLANGRPWDLDRTYGGLRVVHPYLGDDESGWYEGNADAIHRNREAIEEFEPEVVLTLSADAVYRLDYRAVIEQHRDRGAELTMVTTRVAADEAARFGVVVADDEGRITRFAYKPEQPETDVVAAEVFVYDAPLLLETLDGLGDDELKDFGHGLVPELVERGRAHAYDLNDHWRDVGTPESYWAAHMELVDERPPFRLDEPDWPILTGILARAPARVRTGAVVADSLVSPGCDIRGRVVRSVLGPGVVVEADAEVVESVVLDDAVVAAPVSRAVVDAGMRVDEARHASDDIAVIAAK